jgi:galactokinase
MRTQTNWSSLSKVTRPKSGSDETMNPAAELVETFRGKFKGTPQLYRAPGRVNLIGEHTDYNDGFVMPAAIGLYCWIAAAPRDDRQLSICSTNFGETITVPLEDGELEPRNDWTDYVIGTALSLQKMGHRLRGADIMISGQVPLGSGLSSSAAIEVSTAYALLDLSHIPIDRVSIAKACQRAENDFVGAHVGIMDQFISANGEADHALMLDCRSLDFQLLPIPENVRLVVCNTGVKHEIAGGEYNLRRAQCEEGVERLKKVLPKIHKLRDVTPEALERHKHLLPEVIYRRCRHIVLEDVRVENAAEALKSGNLELFGKLMAESHASLRDDYEVSCKELDIMVEIASAQPGVIGARMTGGGFGGCTINLVPVNAAEGFQASVAAAYQQQTGINPDIYVLTAAAGASPVSAQCDGN